MESIRRMLFEIIPSLAEDDDGGAIIRPYYPADHQSNNNYYNYDHHHNGIQSLRRLQQDQTTTSAEDGEEELTDEPNILGTTLSYVFLFFLIFGLSATVEVKNLKKQLQNKFAIGTGVAMQFLIMPVLGFLAVFSLRGQPGWTKEMGVTLLVVTSSPGGSYSNWWCSLFNADLALSVAMTTVSSLMSMAMLPLNLFLYTFLAYGRSEEASVVEALDFGTIFLALGIVLFAIVSGLVAGYYNDNKSFHIMANRLGSMSGLLLVLFSLFLSSGADGAEDNFWNQDWAFYVGVAFPCLVGIALANVMSRGLRLAPPETVAISIECCYQNTGIATSVAIAMYDDKEERARAVAVPLFYGVVEAVAIGIYCVWAWKVGWTKAPKDEKFCVMLTSTYEVSDDDEDGNNNDDDAYLDDTTNAPEEYGDESSRGGGRSVDRRGSFQRENSTATTGDSPSVTTSRFADEYGNSTRSSDDPKHLKASSSSTSNTTIPFWRRWRWFGGSRSRDQGSTVTASTNGSSPQKPFRNDAALAAVLGAVEENDDGVATGKGHRRTTSASSATRHRSFTMETTTSSRSGNDYPEASHGNNNNMNLKKNHHSSSQTRLESLPDTVGSPTRPQDNHGSPPRQRLGEASENDVNEAPFSATEALSPTSITTSPDEDDDEDDNSDDLEVGQRQFL